MSQPETEPIVIAEGISKHYPGTLALDDVDFAIYPGEVSVVIGENGAGKSTLMKILAGVEVPTAGRITMEGRRIEMHEPREAWRYGIGIIYQELNLFPNLSIAENIFMAREITSLVGSVRHRKQKARAAELLERLDQDLSPGTLVEDLRIGQQQLVEIARALAEDVRVLIMDEPTSALSTRESEALFGIIRELVAQGVAIVYISHKLDECLEIGDRFFVMRDGRMVAENVREKIDLSWIVRNMAGRSEEDLYFRSNRSAGKPLLIVKDLCLPSPHRGGLILDHVSFTVHAGEVVGLYGLMGAGKTEILECLFGLHPEATGTIRLGGLALDSMRLDERLEAGLALIPEDRQRQGLIQTMSATENMTLASLRAHMRLSGISRQVERQTITAYQKSLGIKMSHPDQSITTLSGGNQQKIVVSKALLTAPAVLMMDEPTRGIDVGAKSDILRMIDGLAEDGLGILMASSEVKEVVSASDRVIVLSHGRISAEHAGPKLSEQAIVAASVDNPETMIPTEPAG